MRTPAIHSTALPSMWALLGAALLAAALLVGAGFQSPLFQMSGGPVWRAPEELNMQSPAGRKDSQKPKPRIPEMVGATSAPFVIGPGPTQISLEIHAPTGPASRAGSGTQREVTLTIENLKSEKTSPSFDVYINLPPGELPRHHPEALAGSLGMFGLVEASTADAEHGGNGKSFTLSITRQFARLALEKDWDGRTVRILFIPGVWDAPIPTLQVGRAAVYFL